MSNEKTNNQKISNEKVNVNIDILGIDKLNAIENQIKQLSRQNHVIHLTLDTPSIDEKSSFLKGIINDGSTASNVLSSLTEQLNNFRGAISAIKGIAEIQNLGYA